MEKDLKRLKTDFDARSWLDDIGVAYREAGEENVGDGWIGIDCPFCGIGLGHLGIHCEEGNYFRCWNCLETGDIIALIRALEEVGFQQAKARLEQHQVLFPAPREERPKREYAKVLPENFEYIFEGEEPLLVKQWFRKRGFDLGICREYELGWVPHGEYQLRLIVPMRLDRAVVSFQAVDMTGQARIPYLDCPRDRALVPNDCLLYGIEDVGRQVILVEGVTDRWRMGRDAKAMLTKNWTYAQIILLHRRARGVRVKVLLDMDAMREGKRLANMLTELFPDVVFIGLDEAKDPDRLSAKEVERICKY